MNSAIAAAHNESTTRTMPSSSARTRVPLVLTKPRDVKLAKNRIDRYMHILCQWKHKVEWATHCAFSSNLFHGQITRKMSSPENKNCRPWKGFGVKPPSHPARYFWAKEALECPDASLSQHYIGPEMTFWHFSNLCSKKLPGLTKEVSCSHLMNLEV